MSHCAHERPSDSDLQHTLEIHASGVLIGRWAVRAARVSTAQRAAHRWYVRIRSSK
jgi:hypothetical protein